MTHITTTAPATSQQRQPGRQGGEDYGLCTSRRCGTCTRFPGDHGGCGGVGYMRTVGVYTRACGNHSARTRRRRVPVMQAREVAAQVVKTCATCRRPMCDWAKKSPCIWWEGAQ